MIKKYLLFLTCLFVISSPSFACWGFRPMAMGGIFTAVADDANLAYWNRAGAAQLENWRDGEQQLVLTSQAWSPAGYFNTEPRSGNTYYDSINYAQKINQGNGLSLAASWSGGGSYYLSYGRAFSLPWFEAMSVGVGYVVYRTEGYGIYQSQLVRLDYLERVIDLDYLWRFHPEWSFGVHIENFWLLSGEYTSPDNSSLQIKVCQGILQSPNVRPALAWSPKGKLQGLVVNAGVYDLLALYGGPYYSGGFEYSPQPGQRFYRSSFRAGYYNYKSVTTPGFMTLGYGYKLNDGWELGYWGAYVIAGNSAGVVNHNIGLAVRF